MRAMRKQDGITLTGMLMGCVVLGGCALIFMKLWPVYNEKFKVDLAMDKLAATPNSAQLGKTGMAKVLQKQFDVNDVEPVPSRQLAKMLKVKRIKGGGKSVTFAYEIRAPFFSNLDVAMNYNKSVVLGKKAAE